MALQQFVAHYRIAFGKQIKYKLLWHLIKQLAVLDACILCITLLLWWCIPRTVQGNYISFREYSEEPLSGSYQHTRRSLLHTAMDSISASFKRKSNIPMFSRCLSLLLLFGIMAWPRCSMYLNAIWAFVFACLSPIHLSLSSVVMSGSSFFFAERLGLPSGE